jgi:hypothetical protein
MLCPLTTLPVHLTRLRRWTRPNLWYLEILLLHPAATVQFLRELCSYYKSRQHVLQTVAESREVSQNNMTVSRCDISPKWFLQSCVFDPESRVTAEALSHCTVASRETNRGRLRADHSLLPLVKFIATPLESVR